MVHVIARQVAPGPDLADGEGKGVPVEDMDPAVIGGHHPAAQFAGQVRVGEVLPVHFRALVRPEHFRRDDGGETAFPEAERVPVIAGHVRQFPVPEPVGIVPVEGQDFPEDGGTLHLGPSGPGV